MKYEITIVATDALNGIGTADVVAIPSWFGKLIGRRPARASFRRGYQHPSIRETPRWRNATNAYRLPEADRLHRELERAWVQVVAPHRLKKGWTEIDDLPVARAKETP